MKKLFIAGALLLGLTSCTDPLDIAYTDSTYQETLFELRKKYPTEANYIVDELKRGNPDLIGVSYRNILESFNDRKLKIIDNIKELEGVYAQVDKIDSVGENLLKYEVLKVKTWKPYYSSLYRTEVVFKITNISGKDIELYSQHGYLLQKGTKPYDKDNTYMLVDVNANDLKSGESKVIKDIGYDNFKGFKANELTIVPSGGYTSYQLKNEPFRNTEVVYKLIKEAKSLIKPLLTDVMIQALIEEDETLFDYYLWVGAELNVENIKEVIKDW